MIANGTEERDAAYQTGRVHALFAVIGAFASLPGDTPMTTGRVVNILKAMLECVENPEPPVGDN